MWIRTTTTIVKRYEDLSVNIVDLESRLQSLYITLHNFKEGVDLMYKWADATTQSMDKMTIISLEIHILIRQIRELKVCFICFRHSYHGLHGLYDKKDFKQSLVR